MQIVQQLGELKQSLGAGGLAVVAGQALQLVDVGGPQLVEALLVLQALHRDWGGRRGKNGALIHQTKPKTFNSAHSAVKIEYKKSDKRKMTTCKYLLFTYPEQRTGNSDTRAS